MNRATPKMRDFAVRLIACEKGEHKHSRTPSHVAFRVCEKLRPYLATLMGSTGFHAILSRAHSLAVAEVPLLRAVQVNTDGLLAEADSPEKPMDPGEFAEGSVVLLAQLLGLLVALIGENLTLRLLRDVWPKLTASDSYFSNRDPK